MTVLFPTLQELARLGSVAARGPPAVIWSGLVVQLLRYRTTINNHAAARDSHRRDDRGDHSGKGTGTWFRASPPTTRLPAGASPSPLSFSKRSTSQRWPHDGSNARPSVHASNGPVVWIDHWVIGVPVASNSSTLSVRPRSRRDARIGPFDQVQLVHTGEPLERHVAARAEVDAREAADRVPERRRHDDLLPMRLGRDPRCQDDRPAEELLGVADGLTAVEADANADRLLGVGPTVGGEVALDGDRAEERTPRIVEREQEAVALEVELDTAVTPDLFAHDPIVRADDLVRLQITQALGHLG